MISFDYVLTVIDYKATLYRDYCEAIYAIENSKLSGKFNNPYTLLGDIIEAAGRVSKFQKIFNEEVISNFIKECTGKPINLTSTYVKLGDIKGVSQKIVVGSFGYLYVSVFYIYFVYRDIDSVLVMRVDRPTIMREKENHNLYGMIIYCLFKCGLLLTPNGILRAGKGACVQNLKENYDIATCEDLELLVPILT